MMETMTNSSYFLLTSLLIEKLLKKTKACRQQNYFLTSSFYNNNSLMLPKLRQKSFVDFILREVSVLGSVSGARGRALDL